VFFIGYLPWETVFRTLDSFFAEGPNILLQVGMAVLITHKDSIINSCSDIPMVLDYLANAKYDCASLCKLAFEDLTIDYDKVNTLRNYHKFKTIQDMAKRNVEVMLSDLQRKTKFKRAELVALHTDFMSVLSGETIHSHSVNFVQFAKLTVMHSQYWWPFNSRGKEQNIFGFFDRDANGQLSFVEYVVALNLIKNGMLLQLQKIVFDVFSSGGHINGDTCTGAIATLHALLQIQSKFVQVANSEDMRQAYTELAEDPEKQERIDFETFQRLTHMVAKKV